MHFYKLLINGTLVDTAKYKFLASADLSIKNPVEILRMQREVARGLASKETEALFFAKYCIAEKEHVELAVRSAHEASLEYQRFTFKKRVKIMNDIHDLLIEKKSELIHLMTVEGHPEMLAEWEFSGMEMAYRSKSIDRKSTRLNSSH